MELKNVTLEMSLKPFYEMTPEVIESVCRTMFRQWAPLIERADQVSIMLWIGDGSEILDYKGDLDEEIEWARYIGGANPRQYIAGDPEGQCLHSRWYLYRDNPPVIRYRDLQTINSELKRIGQEMTGKPVRVGETFDPGPEFAKSSFKYERHNEICLSGTMGRTSFVCCYGVLSGDSERYAGYPDGIPEGTPFGTFLGRQSQHFLTDLGFDYLWLSNGFGFGMETWGTTGAIFDGKEFHPDRIAETRGKLLDFWRLFREECPDFPLETRGTNLTTGADLVSDAVPLADIYKGGFNMEPPPNSPWAALNGDFGFELTGFMSHIAEVPGETYPFRYYVHDPWWLNSPWLDRYGREPHDIYMPLAVSRVDGNGRTMNPSSVSILTVDDSYGKMPDKCPLEVNPHVLAALDDAPTEPGPLVWVYPFAEYHEWTFSDHPRLEEVFFGDWFIRAAINQGLPLNTVVSSTGFVAAPPETWRERVLVSVAPDAGTPLAEALIAHVHSGGKLLLYGPLTHADPRLLEMLGVTLAEPLEGEMQMQVDNLLDENAQGETSLAVRHNALLTGGGVSECAADAGSVFATLTAESGERAAGVHSGGLAWVRGADSYSFPGGHLLATPPTDQAFPGGLLMRVALDRLGLHVAALKKNAGQRPPITCISRHDNGFFLSGYTPDTTVALRLRLPQGAPVLVGAETELSEGRAVWHQPRAWHRECRVFVDGQSEGVISCLEQHSGEIGITRRLLLRGLENATVRFYPVTGMEGTVQMLSNPRYPYIVGDFVTPQADADFVGCVMAEGLSGELLISW